MNGISHEQYMTLEHIATELGTTLEAVVKQMAGTLAWHSVMDRMTPITREWWRLQTERMNAAEASALATHDAILKAKFGTPGVRPMRTTLALPVKPAAHVVKKGDVPNLPNTPDGGVLLTEQFEALLRKTKVEDEVIESLRKSLAASTKNRSFAHVYARAMYRAFVRNGMKGLTTQVDYLMCNLAQWKGEDAREAKKVLRAFARRPYRD